jgi:hypothetical protein
MQSSAIDTISIRAGREAIGRTGDARFEAILVRTKLVRLVSATEQKVFFVLRGTFMYNSLE